MYYWNKRGYSQDSFLITCAMQKERTNWTESNKWMFFWQTASLVWKWWCRNCSYPLVCSWQESDSTLCQSGLFIVQTGVNLLFEIWVVWMWWRCVFKSFSRKQCFLYFLDHNQMNIDYMYMKYNTRQHCLCNCGVVHHHFGCYFASGLFYACS